jgi:hypothetical protein
MSCTHMSNAKAASPSGHLSHEVNKNWPEFRRHRLLLPLDVVIATDPSHQGSSYQVWGPLEMEYFE